MKNELMLVRIKLRTTEVTATLRALEKAAGTATQIEIGLLKTFATDEREIEYVAPFSLADISLTSGRRADTTRVEIVIKTAIRDSDSSPDAVYERIEKF